MKVERALKDWRRSMDCFCRSRERLHRFLPIFVAVGIVATALIGEPAGGSPALTAHDTSSPTAQARPALRIGLSYGDLPGLSEAALSRMFDDAVSLGVGWLRVDLAWSEVQP